MIVQFNCSGSIRLCFALSKPRNFVAHGCKSYSRRHRTTSTTHTQQFMIYKHTAHMHAYHTPKKRRTNIPKCSKNDVYFVSASPSQFLFCIASNEAPLHRQQNENKSALEKRISFLCASLNCVSVIFVTQVIKTF